MSESGKGQEGTPQPAVPAEKVSAEQKEFGLTNFAINHSTSVLMGMILILIMGMTAYITLPKEAAPEIEIPFLAVNTVYPGVSPKDIETLVTRPIEEEVNDISDVKEIQSSSVEGYSAISIEFNTGVDIDDALAKVREKVDLAKPDMPDDIEEPQIYEFNFAEFPIMQVNVSGEYDLVLLKEVAEELKDEIDQVPSVLEVVLSGGLEREVKVDVSLAKLKFYGLSFDDVIDAIDFENVTIPGGSIDVGEMSYLVRVPGEFQQANPIADIVVTTKNGRPIYVRDVATVDFGFEDRTSYARLNGNPVVTLSVSKRSGENILATADAVRAAIDRLRPTFPPTTQITITSDNSKEVGRMVNSLENNMISAGILVVAVLMFFLGVRNSGFVAVSIPLSMLLACLVIQVLGMTINFIVLFSLILALGMLVDNAIVVVENIYRHLEHGYSNFEAARRATGEVALPIISSTATTLAAFAPLLFWPGIVGDFMGYLPKTLIITLISSLFVALTIVPTLAALYMRVDGREGGGVRLTRLARIVAVAVAGVLVLVALVRNPILGIMFVLTGLGLWFGLRVVIARVCLLFQMRVFPALIGSYERWLLRALRYRFRTMTAAVLMLVLSVTAYAFLGRGVVFFPENIPPAFGYVQVETPVGTVLERTDEIVRRVEGRLNGVDGRDDIETVVATTGSKISNTFEQTEGSHLATVSMSFVDFEKRRQNAFQVLENVRGAVGKGIAGAEVSVVKPQEGPPTGPPVNIEISGESPERLKELSQRALSILEQSPVYGKLDALKSNLDEARPELTVQVDREKAALYGLNTSDIGRTVRSAINGTEASKFRYGEDEYDITVRLAPQDRSDLSALGDLTVVDDEGNQIPLSSVATWKVGSSLAGVNRLDLERVVQISADVRAAYNANATLAEVQGVLADFQKSLPPGYNMRYTGESEEQDEASEFLTRAFFTAILLIAFILVSQFNSITKPFIILTSVILSTVGVLLGLIVFRMPFCIIMTGIGVISLAGIVVNNSIVLIDYIQILRTRDGMSGFDSVVLAGKTRFRPVVLTAVTTVLGLVPLAMGLNFDFLGLYTHLKPDLYWGGEQAAWWGPMAIAVIAGLTFATFLTLILVPVMVTMSDDFADWMKRHFIKREPAAHTVGEGGRGAGDAARDETPQPEPSRA